MMRQRLATDVDIGNNKTSIGHIITPGTNLVKAYNSSHPEDLSKNIYWLYFDYYCHIIGYDNGYANVRIGKETCWIDMKSLEEVVFTCKIVSKTAIYKDANTDSDVIGTIDANEEAIIIDYNINNFIKVFYKGQVGFIESASTDFNFKQFNGKNDGEIAVELVKTKLGCPYEWAMSGPDTFDCSGLMQWAYNRLDIFIHRTADVQSYNGKRLQSKDELLPGDLITFCKDEAHPNQITHVGMYIGNGKFIHATGSVHKVIESDVDTYEWPIKTMNRYWG